MHFKLLTHCFELKTHCRLQQLFLLVLKCGVCYLLTVIHVYYLTMLLNSLMR